MKKYSAGEFGRLIGLDRIPEERCLRKKLSVLSEDGRAEVWSAQLAEKWLGEQKEDVGFLYVDGHVKEYSGGSKLPRRYVSRQRLCLRGISNYWVNDALGQPFFFIEKQIDPGLIKVLENEIIPRLLKDVPNQPSETDLAAEPLLHRFITVFDREGYSPALFRRLWDNSRVACLTYKKSCKDKWPSGEFSCRRVNMPNGEIVEMSLAERGVLLGDARKHEPIWCKEIRKKTEHIQLF